MNKVILRTYLKWRIYESPNGAAIYQNFWYRWMTFNTRPIQTLVNRRHPERPLLNYIQPLTVAARHDPGETCLMGLGGAAIGHYLKANQPKLNLDVIEIDDEVIQLAEKYFRLNELSQLNIIQQDAAQFMQHPPKTYRHLLIDLFDAYHFPTSCDNPLFFKQCYENLEKEGILAINLANPTQHRRIYHFLQSHFDQGIVTVPIEHSTNMVMLASKTQSIDTLLDYFYLNFKVKMQQWDPDWGYMIAI